MCSGTKALFVWLVAATFTSYEWSRDLFEKLVGKDPYKLIRLYFFGDSYFIFFIFIYWISGKTVYWEYTS